MGKVCTKFFISGFLIVLSLNRLGGSELTKEPSLNELFPTSPVDLEYVASQAHLFSESYLRKEFSLPKNLEEERQEIISSCKNSGTPYVNLYLTAAWLLYEYKLLNQSYNYVNDIPAHIKYVDKKDPVKVKKYLNQIIQNREYKLQIPYPFSGKSQNYTTGELDLVRQFIAGEQKLTLKFTEDLQHFVLFLARTLEYLETQKSHSIIEINTPIKPSPTIR